MLKEWLSDESLFGWPPRKPAHQHGLFVWLSDCPRQMDCSYFRPCVTMQNIGYFMWRSWQVCCYTPETKAVIAYRWETKDGPFSHIFLCLQLQRRHKRPGFLWCMQTGQSLEDPRLAKFRAFPFPTLWNLQTLYVHKQVVTYGFIIQGPLQ